MRSHFRTAFAPLALMVLCGQAVASVTLSMDAYIVRWQQDVMPMTDASVLGLLVSDEEMRIIAQDVFDLTDDQMGEVSFAIQCLSDAITDHGATIRVSIFVGSQTLDGGQIREALSLPAKPKVGKFRNAVLAAWEENFSNAYKKAVASRVADWENRVSALTEKQKEAEALTNAMRDEFSVAEQAFHLREATTDKISELDRRLADVRMQRDSIAARRSAVEAHIKELKSDGNSKGESAAAEVVEHYIQAVELAKRQLVGIQKLRSKAESSDEKAQLDQRLLAAESAVLEARIELAQARKLAMQDQRLESMLEELRQVNLEFMQLTHAVEFTQRRREEITAQASKHANDISVEAVRQLRVQYEMAEHRLMKLTERLIDLQDSGENMVTPLTFVRLSK